MGKNERQAYLKAIRSRYRRASKKAKAAILDEFCAVCGYHRKYAIRLLNQRRRIRQQRHPGRKPIYPSPELLEYATLEWVDWFNHRRLLGPIGNVPPAEFEQVYYD